MFMNPEWHVPDPSIPVRQGDLLICRNPHKGIVQEICLVITADCDISKGKFGRQLACLHVIPFVDYLRTVWAEKKLRKATKDGTETVRSQIATWHSKSIGADSSLSAEAVTAWVRRAEPDTICSELNIPDPDAKKVRKSLAAFRAALSILDSDTAADKLTQLIKFRSAIQGKDVQTCRQEALHQAKQEQPLPEDVFLLPSLPQLDLGSAVVLLREIVSVKHESVCYRAPDACTDDMFLRVGRLEPTFKYAVSQAFGALYSRIGLPDDYERRCKEVIHQINDLSLE